MRWSEHPDPESSRSGPFRVIRCFRVPSLVRQQGFRSRSAMELGPGAAEHGTVLIEPSQTDHAEFMRRRRGVATLTQATIAMRPVHSEVSVLPLTTAVIGFLLGLGGLREFLVRGIWYGQLQPLLVGAAGALVSSMLLLAAIAIWLQWSRWPRLATLAGALSIVFHVYGALPPGRNVGPLAMTMGVGIGVALLTYVGRHRRVDLQLVEP